MSKDFVRQFIRLYREHPCLWKMKSQDYTNKNLKARAYFTLLDHCRTSGFPKANKEFVIKKIQNLRGCFRKELRKVELSKSTGAEYVYEPNLWYYDLLLFTKDQEESVEGLESGDFPQVLPNEEIYLTNETDDNLESEENKVENQENDSSFFRKPVTPKKGIVNSLRFRKRKLIQSQEEFMKTCAEALRDNRNPSESEVIGLNVTSKLQRMSDTQRLLAESLISKVLMMGLFKELNRTTDIYNPKFVNTSNENNRNSFTNSMYNENSSSSSSSSNNSSPIPLGSQTSAASLKLEVFEEN